MTTTATDHGLETSNDVNLRMHVRFITDRCVAARVDAREQPEWPPHPGRFFMALAAAYFETGGSEDEKQAERYALEWLCSLPSPRIHAVAAEVRSAAVCYVPVNDAAQPNKAMLQSAPGMPRSRQPRSFPTVIPQRMKNWSETAPDITYEWSSPHDLWEHLPALERLCRAVTRVGHSSSLVMSWTDLEKLDVSNGRDYWEPTSATAELACRIAADGELGRLQAACRASQIELFAELKNEIELTTGKAQLAAKKRFAETFGELYKATSRPPEPTPAALGVWQGYRRASAEGDEAHPPHESSYFERDMLILAKHDGPALNIERALGLTYALRAALLALHGGGAVPAWLSGHDPDGSPTSSPHAAFLALPYAGFPHSDGHVMGLAIALPKGIPMSEYSRWLGPLLVDQRSGEVVKASLKLWGKDLPDWTLQLEERPSPPRTLQNSTWTRPSTRWASVTPVVLDRFPKASRAEDRLAWHAEIVDIIKLACIRTGLPEPIEIDFDTTAWHAGIPRACTKTRKLRGGRESLGLAPLGDGFPSLPTRQSRPAKPQVHVWVRFDHAVTGPVVIGAGRFQGYGLCLPVNHARPGARQ